MYMKICAELDQYISHFIKWDSENLTVVKIFRYVLKLGVSQLSD